MHQHLSTRIAIAVAAAAVLPAALATTAPLVRGAGELPTVGLPTAPLPGFWSSTANGDRVNALVRDGDVVWTATAGGGVVRWNLGDGSHEQFLAPQNGLLSSDVRDLLQARDGTLWAATDMGIARMPAGLMRWNAIAMDHPKIPSVSATALAEAPDGSLWIGFEQRWDALAEGHLPDTDGAFVGGGLARYDPATQEWGPFLRAVPLDRHGETFESIPSDNVTSMAVTRSGELWVGTRSYFIWDKNADGGRGGWLRIGGGIAAGDGTQWRSWLPIGPREACLSTHITALDVDTADRVWAATTGRGLQVFREGLKTAACSYLTGHNWYTLQRGAEPNQTIAGNFVWSLDIDEAGRVWAGVGSGYDDGLGISVLDHHDTFEDPNRAWESDDTWATFGLDGRVSSTDAIVSSVAVVSGEMIAGTRVGRDEGSGWGLKLRSADGQWSTLATAATGMPSNRITSMAVDPTTGDLWMGTADRGVARWDGSDWMTWRAFGRGVVATEFAEAAAPGEERVQLAIKSSEFSAAFPGEPRFLFFGSDPTLYRIAGVLSAGDNARVQVSPALAMPQQTGAPVFQVVRGPASDYVEDLTVDRDGRVWAAGRATQWLGNDCPTFPDCWLDGGLSLLDGNQWFAAEELGGGIELREVRTVDSGGGLVWVGAAVANQGADVALAAYDIDSEQWTIHGPESGIGPSGVSDVTIDDATGAAWVAHVSVMGCDPDVTVGCTAKRMGGGVSRWDGTTWQEWSKATGAEILGFGDDADLSAILYDGSRRWAWAGAWEAGPDGFHWSSGVGIQTAVNVCAAPCTDDSWTSAMFGADGPVTGFALDIADRIWVGASRERLGIIPPEAGLRLFVGDKWYQVAADDSPLPDDRVTALSADANAVWVGTYDRGAAVWRQMIPVDHVFLPTVSR